VAVLLGVFVAAMVTLGEFSLHRFTDGVSSPFRTLAEWRTFLTDPFQWQVVGATVKLGAVTTLWCVLVGYVTALALHRLRSSRMRAVCYFVLFSPLLTSVVARTYGWSLVLGDVGFVNGTLAFVGFDQPVPLLYNFAGVVVAMVHILLPFMVFPVLSSLRQIGDDMLEASGDLGAPGWRSFQRVTLPLSLPGLVAGAQLCFALTISAFATPSLLGGGRVQVLATSIYSDVGNLNWPRAAVASYVLLALAVLALVGFGTVQRRVLKAGRAR
jgi:putative spermidine/putrescine transport system permease protein